MLTVSQQALDALSAPQEDAYVERIVARLHKHFPEHTAALGPERTRAETRKLMERGRGYRVSSEYHLFQFVCLGFQFGEAFDLDPKLPWMRATLTARVLGDPDDRVEQAYDLAMAALRQTGRPILPFPGSLR